MQKNKVIPIALVCLIIPIVCRAAEMDNLKVDFLQGNYRRVIFEGQAQVNSLNSSGSDELNYILGLSYLKEARLEQAANCFKLVVVGSSSKLKKQAELGLADTYLMGGQFQEAVDSYNKLIAGESNSSYGAAILYRLSQLEFKRGNNQLGNEYLSKLRRDFPLSPELRLSKGLALNDVLTKPQREVGEYSVQLGFFTNSNNANNLKNKLLADNYPAYVESVDAGYRVRVGRLKTLNEAQVLESELSKKGFQTKICP